MCYGITLTKAIGTKREELLEEVESENGFSTGTAQRLNTNPVGLIMFLVCN